MTTPLNEGTVPAAVPALPGFIRRRIEQAIHDSANPKGMGIHDGKVRVHGSDLAYVLKLVDAIATSAPPPPANVKELVDRLERAAMRKGELWERCQGKGWPDAESDEFTKLRDERCPAIRAALLAATSAPPPVEAREPMPYGSTDSQWIEGEPPAGVDLAWLRVQFQSGDGEGGWDWMVKVMLGTLVDLSDPEDPTHDPEWCEAGDWKGESYGDSIYEDPAFITHWMPYVIPDAGDFGIKNMGPTE